MNQGDIVEQLIVMTFNLKNDTFLTKKEMRWELRRHYAANLIKQRYPDVIGVQEMTSRMKRQLQSVLQGYEFAGKARKTDNDGSASEHTDILFRKDKFSLLSSKTFWLSKKPDQEGSRSWSSVFPRICTCIHIQNKETGTIYALYNTHLDHLFAISRSFEMRVILQAMIEDQKKENVPVILMGDLNTTDKSRTLRYLLENRASVIKLNNVYNSFETSNTLHYGSGKLNANKKPIDYILASDHFTIVSTEIIKSHFNGFYPSDHYPVICRMQLKES